MKRSATVAVTIAVAALAQAVVVLAARNPAIRATPSRDGFRRVDVTYYMESLCPDCAMFGVNELDAAIGNLSEYMNLEIVPYGNARYNAKTDSVKCQHGPEECEMNTIENCLIFLTKVEVEAYWPFIKCADEVVVSSPPPIHTEKIMSQCAEDLPADVPAEKLTDCASGNLGKWLTIIAMKKTEELNPPHTYVPWVTVEGRPIYDTFKNISNIVCAEWAKLNGQSPPPECAGFLAA